MSKATFDVIRGQIKIHMGMKRLALENAQKWVDAGKDDWARECREQADRHEVRMDECHRILELLGGEL